MIKRVTYFLIFMTIMFLGMNSYKAEIYKCAYNATFGNTKYYFELVIDTAEKDDEYATIISADPETLKCEEGTHLTCTEDSISNMDWIVISTNPELSEKQDELLSQLVENIYSGQCDTTVFAYTYWNNREQKRHVDLLLDDTLQAYAMHYLEWIRVAEIQEASVSFVPENSTAPGADVIYNCEFYDLLYEDIKETANDIKANSDKTNLYSLYNQQKSLLKKFCTTQFKYLDYGSSCLTACLNLDDAIRDLGVESLDNGSQCGFSGKLINWIGNIVKWIKYIVPVIVIVMGILDFIKALSSGKDDEMKKAQGHFIKRLIAAALIFIIPFIIEFILNKMGFAANGCGIIDL